jgi:hypothetical protein
LPDNSIKSTPPPVCPSCGAVGTVKQETTIKGASTNAALALHALRSPLADEERRTRGVAIRFSVALRILFDFPRTITAPQ